MASAHFRRALATRLVRNALPGGTDQKAADAIHHGGALLLPAFPHAVTRAPGLLFGGLDRDETHRGITYRERHRLRIVTIILNAEHELHFVDALDALCKRQLKERSKDLPAGTPWTTDAEFEAITVYFLPPSEDEGFNVVRHERS